MFKRSVIAFLATAGAAAIALTAYLLWKRSQEEQEEAVPEQEPEDEVVRFVDITNDDQTEDKETGSGLSAEKVLDQAEETVEKAAEAVEELKETVQETADEAVEEAADKAEELKEAVEEAVEEKTEEASEAVEELKETVEETAEKAAEFTETVEETVEEAAEEVKEAVEETAEELTEEEPQAAEEVPAEEEQPVRSEADELDALLDEVLKTEDLPMDEESLRNIDLGVDVPEEQLETAVAGKPYAPEVEQIAELYQFLDKDFIEELFYKNSEFTSKFPVDTLIRLSHKCYFSDTAIMREFERIAVNNGYAAEEMNDHETVVSRKMFTEEGSILSDIFNVANQVEALHGSYEGYRID
ncbi:MAG: YtxH domain-containing protein [Solobacterium sp.]|nr:YtxH domain-containing protein [Solobacterium sp.]